MGLWRHGTLFKYQFLAVESRGGAAACRGGSAAAAAGDDGFGDHGALVIVVDDGVGDDGDGGDCLFCSCDKNTIAKAAYRRTRLLGLTVQRVKSPSWQRGVAANCRHGDRSWKPRPHISNHKHQAERTNQGQWVTFKPQSW